MNKTTQICLVFVCSFIFICCKEKDSSKENLETLQLIGKGLKYELSDNIDSAIICYKESLLLKENIYQDDARFKLADLYYKKWETNKNNKKSKLYVDSALVLLSHLVKRNADKNKLFILRQKLLNNIKYLHEIDGKVYIIK